MGHHWGMFLSILPYSGCGRMDFSLNQESVAELGETVVTFVRILDPNYRYVRILNR